LPCKLRGSNAGPVLGTSRSPAKWLGAVRWFRSNGRSAQGGRARPCSAATSWTAAIRSTARLHQGRGTADCVLRPRDESRLWPWRQNRRTLDHGRPSPHRGRRRQVLAPRNTSFPKDPATAVIPSSSGGEYQPQTTGASDMSTTRKSSGPQLVINSPEDEATKTADLNQIERVW